MTPINKERAALFETRKNCLKVALSSRGKLFLRAMMYVRNMRMIPMLMPGTKPAKNRAPIEVFVKLPKTTMVRQGGIRTPIPPAAVTKAAEKFGA
jgi:hypothetical protein